MKKLTVQLLFTFILAVALSSCGNEKKVRKWNDGEMVGIAFLGNFDNYDSFRDSPEYDTYCETYPEIENLDKFEIDYFGTEVYLIIPCDPAASVSVNSYSFEDFMNEGASHDAQVLYRSDEGRPFLIKCNDNDTMSNVVITIVNNKSEVKEIHPRVSIEQPQIVIDDHNVRDLTVDFAALEGYNEASYEYDRFGIQAWVSGGSPVLYVNTDILFESGMFSPEYYMLPEGAVKLTGINGICKGVFIGDIGQDYNPILCALMSNGDVRILSIFDALRTGNVRMSERLDKIHDITGFVNDGADPLPDGGWSYVTIYAIDKNGDRTEIPY